MGDHQHGGAGGGDDAHQLVLQARARQRIERTEGLVEQQHPGLHRQRPRDTHALLHAARDLGGPLVRGLREPDQRQRGLGARLQRLAPLLAAEDPLDGQVDVVVAAHPRQQRVALEDHRAVRARVTDLAVGQQQHTAGGLEQAGHEVEQGRLAAAGMTDQRHELAARDRQVDVAQRGERALAGLEDDARAFDGEVARVGGRGGARGVHRAALSGSRSVGPAASARSRAGGRPRRSRRSRR